MHTTNKRLEKAYRDFGPRILRFIMSKVHCRETAQDLTQDTFIRFFQADQKGQVKEVIAYLYRIARNIVIDHIRTVKAKFAPKEIIELSDVTDLIASQDDLDELLAHRVRIRETCDAMSALPTSCQRIFWLSRLHGYKNNEIAKEEGVCLSTVEKNISKAVKHCRSIMILQAA